jgi:hypothetical protein
VQWCPPGCPLCYPRGCPIPALFHVYCLLAVCVTMAALVTLPFPPLVARPGLPVCLTCIVRPPGCATCWLSTGPRASPPAHPVVLPTGPSAVVSPWMPTVLPTWLPHPRPFSCVLPPGSLCDHGSPSYPTVSSSRCPSLPPSLPDMYRAPSWVRHRLAIDRSARFAAGPPHGSAYWQPSHAAVSTPSPGPAHLQLP